jgi:hypothetical protein
MRDTLDKKILLLRKYTEWARQKAAETGNSAPNKQSIKPPLNMGYYNY